MMQQFDGLGDSNDSEGEDSDSNMFQENSENDPTKQALCDQDARSGCTRAVD